MGQTTWSWLVIIYLFLGGLGAGAFLTAAFFELKGWRYRREFSPTVLAGATISGPAVVLGSALLVLDLGAGKTQPWRIFYLFTGFSSVMTWGIWILFLFIPVALFYGLLEIVAVEPFLNGLVSARLPGLLRNIKKIRRWVAIVGSVLAVGTAIYTGVLLSDVGPAIPLWSQPLLPFSSLPILPVIFLVSALSTGLALTFDLAGVMSDRHIHDEIKSMPFIHVSLIGLEIVLIGLLLISAFAAGGAAAESARLVVYGPLRVIFWVGIVVVGLLLPFTIHTLALNGKRHSLALTIGSGAAVVLAGLFLRYIVVAAGIPAGL
ncbi:MAG: polysulfide reductase NrfD [Anaerolineae bacterium]|jgi:formate-dependent nitrite reductase membrane component NrfD